MAVWDWDWGDIPTWIAAVFGGGAFAGALLLFRIEAGRDREQAAARRQQQASLISAWVANNSDKSNLAVHLLNGSSACVYDIWILYTALGKTLDYEVLSVLWPNVQTPRAIDLTEKAAARFRETLPTVEPSDWDDVRPTLFFRDSANVPWQRDRNGVLAECKNGEWVPPGIVMDHRERTEEKFRQRLERRARAGEG
jgi:hypothetical protein